MAGMGKPYGLIGDESDFLIHPARIVSGEGVKYYLDCQFNYTGLTHLDSKIDFDYDPIFRGNANSAQEYEHNSLIGAAFPLAKGRLGVFFAYDQKDGDFDSNVDLLGGYSRLKSDADSELDNYALKLIYGQPIMNLNLGVELGIAYRNENQKEWLSYSKYGYGSDEEHGDFYWRDVYGIHGAGATLPFMVPYDSQYWEMSGKVGLNKKLNAMDIDWTVYGGYILSADSDNKYKVRAGLMHHAETYDGSDFYEGGEGIRNNMDGDVRGYRIGSDLWVRHQLNEELSLPFLVSVEYTKKDRDGKNPVFYYEYETGPGYWDYEMENTGVNLNYKHVARTLNIKAGGGVEKACEGCGRLGAGLYYNYIQSRDRIGVGGLYESEDEFGSFYANINKFPYHKEHRLVLAVAGEQIISADCTVRGGMNFFYGWVRSDDYGGSANGGYYIYGDGSGYGWGKGSLPLDGRNWGIDGSLGATKKIFGLTVEPFIKGGYRLFDVGDRTYFGGDSVRLDKKRAEWFTGGGFSILFGKI
ncbi:MAG TPA: hypothetical protein PKV48_05940, partial [Thermodesulfobacteriota bacterium]|nr:hypothetical protein [Thermodesulfobacteriota bacterium]